MVVSSQEDDPFACFGDDDDDDDDAHSSLVGDVNDGSRDRALRLMESHKAKECGEDNNNNNRRRTTNSNTPPTRSQPANHHHNIPSSNYKDQRLRTSLLPWPEVPPLYMGPMQLLEKNGSSMGRGYVATTDLRPGTCILIETPIIYGWSTSQSGKRLGLDSVKYILEKENANAIVKCMEELHPRKVQVDACSLWLFPLFTGEKSCHDSNEMDGAHDDEAGGDANKNKMSMAPIDKIQIVDMMSEIMMPTINTDDEDVDYNNKNNNDSSMSISINKDPGHHQIQQQVQSLVSYAAQRNIHNTNGSAINCIDIVRLLLALRYNGFDSGLYLHFSMFNHGEDPNCIKFRPVALLSVEEEEDTAVHYSEARTTRYIRKGEALTLHYLENPREVSHSTRRRQLWEQHRFDIGGDGDRYGQHLDGEACRAEYLPQDTTRGRCIFESELIHGEFPNNSVARVVGGDDENVGSSNILDIDTHTCHTAVVNDITSNIEKTLDELEDILLDLRASTTAPSSPKSSKLIHRNKDRKTHTTSSSSSINHYFDQAAALELTIQELITTSTSILGNSHHILLARCRRLHIDVIEVLLATSLLTERQSNELMMRFILSSGQLLESQRRRLGSDHPDVARTCQDYCMGIQALLSHAPRRLLLLDVFDEDDREVGETMTKKKTMGRTKKTTRWTLDQWSKMEHYCRKEKERIEELYPRDVDGILKSVQKNE